MAELKSVTIGKQTVTEGEQYRLQKPDFKPHINGGPAPKGFTYNGIKISWGDSVEAHLNDNEPDVYTDSGTIYVHGRIIADMRQNDKQFHKLP